MLMPKRVKYRKQFKGRMNGKATRGARISFGEYGLQTVPERFHPAIEAAERRLGNTRLRHLDDRDKARLRGGGGRGLQVPLVGQGIIVAVAPINRRRIKPVILMEGECCRLQQGDDRLVNLAAIKNAAAG